MTAACPVYPEGFPVNRSLPAIDEAGTHDPRHPTGGASNLKWISEKLAPHAPVSIMLRQGWEADALREGYVAANRRLLAVDDRLYVSDLRLSMDDAETRQWCDDKAGECRVIAARHDEQEAVRRVTALVERYGLDFPIQGDLFTPALARCSDVHWWLRKVRKMQGRALDEIARDYRLVHAGRQTYTSDQNLQRRRRQKQRNRAILSDLLATNEDGEQFSLQELSDLSVSNPEIRRSELMVRIAGFEEVANLRGLVGEFYTLTCPSRFHPMTAVYKTVWQWNQKTRKRYKKRVFSHVIRNEKYDGSSVGDCQQYLGAVWCRIRACLHRRGIRVFGFRVVEPHHDGSPHWHFLLFMDRDNSRGVRAVFRDHALREDGAEPGAWRYRFKAVAIDSERGTAAGYIAKYISKNINGKGLDAHGGDLFGSGDGFTGDGVSGSERVEAWASCHSIRQFQQIGGPSVTVWRELRRWQGVAPSEGWNDELSTAEPSHDILQECAAAADASDWAAFVEFMGGPFCGREQAVRPMYWQEFDQDTGEMFDPPVNRYGEPSQGRLAGVWCVGVAFLTRIYRWTVERVKAPGSVSEGRQGAHWQIPSMPGAFFSGAPPGAPLEFCQ